MLTLHYEIITGPIRYNLQRQCFHLVCGDTEYYVPTAKLVASSGLVVRKNDVRVILKYDAELQRPVAEPLFSMIREIRNAEECNEFDAVKTSFKRVNHVLSNATPTVSDSMEVTVTCYFTDSQMDSKLNAFLRFTNKHFRTLMRAASKEPEDHTGAGKK